MKVIHLSHSDISGGAARAAYRIHHALRRSDVESWMWVNNASAGDWTIEGPRTRMEKASARIRALAVKALVRTLKTRNPILHSPQLLPSSWVKRINSSDADIVHLHWVQGEMLSVRDIGRITKPIVCTLHDMWAFCGAEHLAWDDRWREGYRRSNRPGHEAGFDLNRWTWRRKRKLWQTPMQIVTPSRWLADCVRRSALMNDWPVVVIPNAIDTDCWKPIQKELARELLGLPMDASLLLFGAIGGTTEHHKGFDLLREALRHLSKAPEAKGIELVIFGQLAPKDPPDLGFPTHYTGHLSDDLALRALYSSADVTIVPSRQESFGQTASESHACGTPVVAFDTGGLPDVVRHEKTGYLAKAFETEELAAAILRVLKHRNPDELSNNARQHAVVEFDSKVVADKYTELYRNVLPPMQLSRQTESVSLKSIPG